MVLPAGIEPARVHLQGGCSTELSYDSMPDWRGTGVGGVPLLRHVGSGSAAPFITDRPSLVAGAGAFPSLTVSGGLAAHLRSASESRRGPDWGSAPEAERRLSRPIDRVPMAASEMGSPGRAAILSKLLRRGEVVRLAAEAASSSPSASNSCAPERELLPASQPARARCLPLAPCSPPSCPEACWSVRIWLRAPSCTA